MTSGSLGVKSRRHASSEYSSPWYESCFFPEPGASGSECAVAQGRATTRKDTTMTGRKGEMRQDLKQAVLWSLGVAFLLTLALALGPSAAFAQGTPAPGPNQAFLYEMSEDAQLCVNGVALVPGLGGKLVPSGACAVQSLSAGVFRNAVSALQGVSALNSPLCPGLVTNPKSDTCTVTVTGYDSVELNPTTFVPAGGAGWGTSAVVIQLDTPVDSPAWPLVPGAVHGTITFGNPGVPIGSP